VVWIDPEGLWEFGGEVYAGAGGGISVGRDPCTGKFYFRAKAGFGIGGGVTYAPGATRPGPACSTGGGSFFGLSGNAGIQAGLIRYGAGGSIGDAYDSSGQRAGYQGLSYPTDLGDFSVSAPPPPTFFGGGVFGGAEGGLFGL